jgi:hypothetical protein
VADVPSRRELQRARSGSERLALLVTGRTGLTAAFASFVRVSVFFAFLFAVVARVHRRTSKLHQILGVLMSEILQSTAQRKHLRNALCTSGQLFVPVAHQLKAMIEARLTGRYTRSRRVGESLVVRPVVHMGALFSRSLCGTGKAGERQQSRSHHSFSSIHRNFLQLGAIATRMPANPMSKLRRF